MLSVLIPTYNYPVGRLVSALQDQLKASGMEFEILIMEDGSVHFVGENAALSTLSGVRHIALEKNIGRAAIRNKLAEEACFECLLYLDSDSEIVRPDFIEKYRSYLNSGKIILGGRVYNSSLLGTDKSLLTLYGMKREQNTPANIAKRTLTPVFTTPNFIIPRQVMLSVRLNEDFREYGHEDSVFAVDLQRAGYSFGYIDNPVLHAGIEDNATFLAKSEKAMDSLFVIYSRGLYPEMVKHSKLLQFYLKMKKFHLLPLLRLKLKVTEPLIRKNLLSTNPSIFVFDLYKLFYLSKI